MPELPSVGHGIYRLIDVLQANATIVALHHGAAREVPGVPIRFALEAKFFPRYITHHRA